MLAAAEQSQQEARAHLSALAADPQGSERAGHIDALVQAQHPLRHDLLLSLIHI